MAIHDLGRLKKLRPKTALAVTALLCGSAVTFWLLDRSAQEPRPEMTLVSEQNVALPSISKPQAYKPLLPDEAKMENEQLPFSTAPIERALPLVLPSNELLPMGRRTAYDCLTSAIYYEAGNEVGQGKRAVAQVILNRVRHPAFPKTICGVVYQGSERKTGCQFTFTCDGSLARRPTRHGWEQARLIATSAISGAVESSVGMSTHYHANYVMPYWASSLDKVSQIGTHIFYRWKGNWGKRRAFSQTVQLDSATDKPIIAVEFLPMTEEMPSSAAAAAKLASRIIADELAPNSTISVPTPEIKLPSFSNLEADQNKSKLAIDDKNAILK